MKAHHQWPLVSHRIEIPDQERHSAIDKIIEPMKPDIWTGATRDEVYRELTQEDQQSSEAQNEGKVKLTGKLGQFIHMLSVPERCVASMRAWNAASTLSLWSGSTKVSIVPNVCTSMLRFTNVEPEIRMTCSDNFVIA